MVNAVLLRPLSYPDPERVVWLTTRSASGQEGFHNLDFGTWQPAATSFEHMVAWRVVRQLLAESLAYGVEPTDTQTFAFVTLLLTAVAFLACAAPALRAAAVDPVTALRAE